MIKQYEIVTSAVFSLEAVASQLKLANLVLCLDFLAPFFTKRNQMFLEESLVPGLS